MALRPGLEGRLTSQSSARGGAWTALAPMLASIGARAIDLAFALVYLRLLKPEGVGAYQFLVVLTTYLDTLVNFGLNTLLAREAARAPEKTRGLVVAVLRLRVLLWLLAAVPLAVVLGPLRAAAGLPPDAPLAGWLFWLALAPSIVASTATGVLWSRERLDVAAGVAVATTAVKVALGSLLLLGGLGLVGLALTSLLAGTVGALLLVVTAWRVVPVPGPSSSAMGRALSMWGAARESWPLFVNQLLAGLFFKIDSLLLPGLAGAAQAGAYAAAYKVIEGTLVIPSSFTLAIFPRLSQRAESGAGHLAEAYRLGLRLLLQVALPLATLLALLASPIVELLGDRQFLPDGAIALAALVWFMPISFANGLTQYVLIALGRQRSLTPVFLGALVFNLGANWLLIPRLGYVGAALTTVASEAVLAVPFGVLLAHHLPGVSPLREGARPAIAVLLMAPVVWWLRDALGPLPAAAAGAAVYAVALWAFGGIDLEERGLLRRLVARQGA
ncbi:MAG: oligosaccharide flippase family protein [Chloroflexi bacterium]|nr:oligosaccharide flippase family protein [Chloroflexota bacterium]